MADPRDPLESVRTMLDNGWDTANTDDIKPSIDLIFNMKRVDMGNKSSVLIYSPTAQISEFPALGKDLERTTDPVTIDIRTVESRSHALKLLKETKRIMDGKIVNPDADYQEWTRQSVLDLSDKSALLWRFVIETQIKNHVIVRAT